MNTLIILGVIAAVGFAAKFAYKFGYDVGHFNATAAAYDLGKKDTTEKLHKEFAKQLNSDTMESFNRGYHEGTHPPHGAGGRIISRKSKA